MAFIEDIKRAYRQGSMLMRLIFINIGVFVLLHVVAIVMLLFNVWSDDMLHWVELPANLDVKKITAMNTNNGEKRLAK